MMLMLGGYVTGRLGEERFARLSECRIVCMPSRFEGWGIAAIEAAAEGIPVVASRIEGLDEAVLDGRTGTLVDATPENLAAAVRDLWDDPERLGRLSENARKHAEGFRWEKIAGEQREVCEAALQDAHA